MKILDYASNSSRWVRGGLENTTNVVLSNSNVTLVTPSSSPRVLDEEVVLSVKGTISDGEDTVVEVGSATLGDDTTVVHLEDALVSLDGNRDWSLGDGSHQILAGGVWGNILVSLDLTNTFGSLILALSPEVVGSSVWVVSLEHDLVGLGIFESVIHETTIAALVNLVAVNELLLGEGDELTSGLEVSTLKSTSGGE